MGINDKIDEYVGSLNLSKRTAASYKSVLRSFTRWAREHKYYTIGSAARFYEADLKRSGKISESSIKTYTRLVRAFNKWYSDSKNVDLYSMAENVDSPAKHRRNPPLKADAGDIKYICNVARNGGESGLRGRAMLLLAITCSLTPSQIASIKPEDACLSEDGGSVRVPCPDGMTAEVQLTRSARDALVEYLLERGGVPDGLPLVAVTTTKANRKAMPAEDVRKCIAKVLDYLAYDYCDVFNGDCERLVASYISCLDDAGRQELASHAARLYFDSQDLG